MILNLIRRVTSLLGLLYNSFNELVLILVGRMSVGEDGLLRCKWNIRGRCWLDLCGDHLLYVQI